MDNRILIGAITAVVVVVMLGGVLMPVIDDATTGDSESNPDAGWIRMNYDTAAGSTYTVTITPGDDGITVANGTDTQTGSDDTIFYADSNVAVWMQDGTVNILGQNTDGPQFLQPEEAITVTRTAEGVTVASGGDSLSFAAPAWAYVPFSSGSYGYFTDGTAVKTNSPMAAVGGGFAGVYAYNDITRYAGLGLQLQTVMEDGKLTGAYWAKPAAADSLSITPLDPGSITIQPLDPSILDPEPDASIMAVPTPTYTDGDWGYDLTTVGGVQKAVIVSYSGTGGDMAIPSTVGGYDVYKVGQAAYSSSFNSNVVENSSLSGNSTLTIPEGVEVIGASAFMNCTNIKSISLPNSITHIGARAFSNTGITGDVIIPDSVVYVGDNAIATCYSANGLLVVPASVETIGSSAFRYSAFEQLIICSDAIPGSNAFGLSHLTEVLDLSSTVDYSVDRYGIAAGAAVQDNIGDSAGYISFVAIGGDAPLNEGAKQILMAVPVLVIFALIAAAIVIFLKRSY